jgi:hypothetical protein
VLFLRYEDIMYNNVVKLAEFRGCPTMAMQLESRSYSEIRSIMIETVIFPMCCLTQVVMSELNGGSLMLYDVL